MTGDPTASKVQADKRGGVSNLTNAGKGRKKGVPNKTTAALKDMILQALDRKGGVDYLEQQADENPTAFLTLIGKVLPMTLANDPNNPLPAAITVHLIPATDK